MTSIDFSHLRQFSGKGINVGDELIHAYGGVTYVSGPDDFGYVCVLSDKGRLCIYPEDTLFIKPLTYVENLPVYKGDRLYWNEKSTFPGYNVLIKGLYEENPDKLECSSFAVNGVLIYDEGYMQTSRLTWVNPKPIKRKGWINLYRSNKEFPTPSYIHETKEIADSTSKGSSEFIGCIEIEWEETEN